MDKKDYEEKLQKLRMEWKAEKDPIKRAIIERRARALELGYTSTKSIVDIAEEIFNSK